MNVHAIDFQTFLCYAFCIDYLPDLIPSRLFWLVICMELLWTRLVTLSLDPWLIPLKTKGEVTPKSPFFPPWPWSVNQSTKQLLCTGFCCECYQAISSHFLFYWRRESTLRERESAGITYCSHTTHFLGMRPFKTYLWSMLSFHYSVNCACSAHLGQSWRLCLCFFTVLIQRYLIIMIVSIHDYH